MKAIILAGGSGTRLWPLSRKNYPKQFLKLNGDKSLLQQSIIRLQELISPENMVIITNNDYKFHVLSDMNSLSLPVSNVILEPVSKNTAPAIAVGIKYCMEKLSCSKDEVIFVSPSDHIIRPVDKFIEYLKQAAKAAEEGYIVTFGIQPARPETGYGYIKVRSQSPSATRPHSGGLAEESQGEKTEGKSQKYLEVENFVEKPNAGSAEHYLAEGGYYWNSGMFAFSVGTMIEEFQKYSPEIAKMFEMSFDEMITNFQKMPDISIDYAVAEKSGRVVTLPLNLYWNDIGSWDSLYEVLDKDGIGNVKIGDVTTIDTKGTLVIGNKRLISTIGLEDCLIIETDDAVLVAKKGEAQKVKEIVNNLKEAKRKEADEHLTTYRPWGSYTILEEGPRYKIKRIVINSCEKLSLQMHYHRSEHWVVIKGAAKVIIGGKEIFVHENESAYVPKSTPHRLENPGRVPLEIIEVQNGEYVGEDDIIRIDDVYERR